MTKAEGRDRRSGRSRWCSYSSADWSDRNVPTPMDMASVNTRTKPVRTTVEAATWAEATPDNRPTVEAKLSSTPKVKLRKIEAWAAVWGFTMVKSSMCNWRGQESEV